MGLLSAPGRASACGANHVEPSECRTGYGVCRNVGRDRLPRTAITQTKAAAPKAQDKLAIGEEEVKQLLLLIDTEKRGKITKQEWMKFMEAEFERLDKGKNGELDVKELTQSRLRVSHFLSVGK
jgi:hypothetical protein